MSTILSFLDRKEPRFYSAAECQHCGATFHQELEPSAYCSQRCADHGAGEACTDGECTESACLAYWAERGE